MNRLQTRRERVWFRELRGFFSRYVSTIASAFQSGGPTVIEHYRLDFTRDLASVLRRLYRGSMETMRDRLYTDLRLVMRKSAIDIWEDAVLEWIESMVAEKVVTIAEGFFPSIREVVDEGFREGLGQEDVARMIRDRVGSDYAQWKAARIARTENHTASERATYEAAKSLDVETVKEWVSVDDPRTRPDHAEASGQIREMDEPFDVGGSSLMQPGDPGGPPEQIINCRCVALYHPRIGGEIIR